MPTPASGKRRRTMSVSITTRPRLFGQRRSRPMAWGRLGASASHSAMVRKVPRKNPRRRTGSAAIAVAGKGVSPA